jgi:hypothetical protein
LEATESLAARLEMLLIAEENKAFQEQAASDTVVEPSFLLLCVSPHALANAKMKSLSSHA